MSTKVEPMNQATMPDHQDGPKNDDLDMKDVILYYNLMIIFK